MEDPRNVPPEEIRRVLYMLDMARAHIEVADIQLASKNLTACLFAVAYLTDRTPLMVAEQLITSVPASDEWYETIIPDLLRRDS